MDSTQVSAELTFIHYSSYAGEIRYTTEVDGNETQVATPFGLLYQAALDSSADLVPVPARPSATSDDPTTEIRVLLPRQSILDLVAERVRSDWVSKLEQMPTTELLELAKADTESWLQDRLWGQ